MLYGSFSVLFFCMWSIGVGVSVCFFAWTGCRESDGVTVYIGISISTGGVLKHYAILYSIHYISLLNLIPDRARQGKMLAMQVHYRLKQEYGPERRQTPQSSQ